MKLVLVNLAFAALLVSGYSDYNVACSIQNQAQTQVGSRPGIKGICSNNRLPITCIFREGTGVECDGPSGGYTGYELSSLVYSACGCTVEEETERYLKDELNINRH